MTSGTTSMLLGIGGTSASNIFVTCANGTTRHPLKKVGGCSSDYRDGMRLQLSCTRSQVGAPVEVVGHHPWTLD